MKEIGQIPTISVCCILRGSLELSWGFSAEYGCDYFQTITCLIKVYENNLLVADH